jgi:hypothetical protein
MPIELIEHCEWCGVYGEDAGGLYWRHSPLGKENFRKIAVCPDCAKEIDNCEKAQRSYDFNYTGE